MLVFVFALCLAVPDRVDPTPKDSYQSNYGTIIIEGDTFKVQGDGKHKEWQGKGKTLKCGTILVEWSWKGRTKAVGLYLKDDNGNLHGFWDYWDRLPDNVLDDVYAGKIESIGYCNPDYIYKVK